jgi:hypothetical protein
MRRRRLRSAPQLILPFVLDASKLNVADPTVRARSVAAFAAEASAFRPPALFAILVLPVAFSAP